MVMIESGLLAIASVHNRYGGDNFVVEIDLLWKYIAM